MIDLKMNEVKRILSVIFIIFLVLFSLKNSSWVTLEKIINYIAQDPEAQDITMDTIENEYVSSFWNKNDFVNINGLMAHKLKMQGYYSSMGMYVTDDKYIVSSNKKTSTDYEYDQLTSFKEYLDSIGVNLLYVNAPTKYVDDSLFREEFGIETYSNRNADLFLQRISDADITNIDLRQNLEADGLDIKEQFFRTDHHWTPECGLWAAQVISDELNKYCNYNIDTSIYDKSKYTFSEYKECWLGEQGRKLSASYVGLDDYTSIKPNFETNYLIETTEGWKQGTFDDFIDESVYNIENDVYENPSWHYSYNILNSINQNVDAGKVLIVGDSYSNAMKPFLSLGVKEIDTVVLRNYDDTFSLREYVKNGGYDTVIVCYAQFMIGAHDDPSSANYRMFKFDK